MQKFNINNLFTQLLKPSRFFVILKKIYSRLFSYNGGLSNEENLRWIKRNISEISSYANSISPTLWEEAKNQSNIIEENACKTLAKVKYDLGGGAAYPLLYFLTRYYRPENVLETGVAAGFSSFSNIISIRKKSNGKIVQQ